MLGLAMAYVCPKCMYANMLSIASMPYIDALNQKTLGLLLAACCLVSTAVHVICPAWVVVLGAVSDTCGICGALLLVQHQSAAVAV